MHMRPVLPDDMREYMRAHLTAYAERWNAPGDLPNLVRIASAGLRHNPRRVKQWVNSLELRTRLIRERERTSNDHVARLDPPITKNLPMVAKLALIEEEWPEAFASLQRAPKLLKEWHAQADLGSDAIPPSWGREDWRKCAAFLRATSHISVDSIRPFVRLRRSVAERDLPRYDEIHDALTGGNTRLVEEVFSGISATARAAYAQRLDDIVEEELDAGNVDGARHVIQTAITAEPLRESAGVARVLSRAAVEPDLREALPQLPLEALATATSQSAEPMAAKAIWKRIFDALVQDRSTDGHSKARSVVLARALTEGRLDAELCRQIGRWLETEQQRDPELGERPDFGTLTPLVRAHPSWLIEQGFNAATRQLDQDTSAARFNSEQWEIMLLGLREAVVALATAEEVGTRLTDIIINHADGEDTSYLVRPCSDYVEAVLTGGYSVDTFAAGCSSHLGRLWPTKDREPSPADPDEHEWAALGFKLFQSADGNQGDVGDHVVQQFATQTMALANAINAGALPIGTPSVENTGSFYHHLAIQLRTSLHGNAQEAREIIAAISTIDAEHAPDHVAEVLSASASNGYAETIQVVWETQKPLVLKSAESVASTIAARLEIGTDTETAVALLNMMPEILPHASADAAARLASVVWTIFRSEPQHVSRDTARSAILATAAQRGATDALSTWLGTAHADLVSPSEDDADRAAAMLTQLADNFNKEQRSQLAQQLTVWVQDQQVSLERVARIAASLSRLRVELAEPLMNALIERDASLPRDNTRDRAPVVRAALHLGRSSRSSRLRGAATAFERRLVNSGFPEDRAVMEEARQAPNTPEN